MHRSFMRPRAALAGILPFLFAAGCFPDPGPCDQSAAFEVVYSPDGIPAIAGQAVMQTSCGNGGFCHSDGDIPLPDRFGAPNNLGFDTRIAATTAFLCQDPACDAEAGRLDCCNALEPDALRLGAHQDRISSMVGEILLQVQSGSMPPQGEAFARYRSQIEDLGVRFDRIADDGVTATRLPTLIDENATDRDAAQEILQNWLACGAPVIERTIARRGLENVS
ncbi:MAG TPA: hypothetical protein ENK31_08080, partial [Nannocystis exedens]|nr:hypothetical protein [Nannocystis exedens]